MNAVELKKKLKEMGIPDWAYQILGLKNLNDTYCLIYEDSIWKVYYTERGVRFDLKEFANEEDACEYFLEQIKDIT